MAATSTYPELESLRATADIALKTDAGLSELYELKGEVESGAQMGCMLAIERRTGVTYALTEVDVTDLNPRRCNELATSILAQRQLLEPRDIGDELHEAKLAGLHEVLQSPARIYLVSQLAPTTGVVADDLLTVLQCQERSRLPEPEAKSLFTRLVVATKRAHDCGVVLRNIKPESVQVCQPEEGGAYELILVDLHCAAAVPLDDETPTLTGLHGTPEYCAPEVSIWFWHESEPPRLPEPPPAYGSKADLWALGICLHVMLCGCFPFSTSLEEEALLRKINEAEFTFEGSGWGKLSADAQDLVQQLLQRDPNDRPYLEEVLQHPFCAEAVQDLMTRARVHSAPLGDLSDAALAMLDRATLEEDDE